MFDNIINAVKNVTFFSTIWDKIKDFVSWATERLKGFGQHIGIIPSPEMSDEARAMVDNFQSTFAEKAAAADTANMTNVQKFQFGMDNFKSSYDSVYGEGATEKMLSSGDTTQFLADIYGEEEALNVQNMLLHPEMATEEDVEFLDKMTDAAYGKDVDIMNKMMPQMAQYEAGQESTFDGDGLSDEEMAAIMADSDDYIYDEASGAMVSAEKATGALPSDTDMNKTWMNNVDVNTFRQIESGEWVSENVDYDEDKNMFYQINNGERGDIISHGDLENQHMVISDDDMRKLCGKEKVDEDWIKSVDLDRYNLSDDGDYLYGQIESDGAGSYTMEKNGEKVTMDRDEMIKNHYLIEASQMTEEKHRRHEEKASARFGDIVPENENENQAQCD